MTTSARCMVPHRSLSPMRTAASSNSKMSPFFFSRFKRETSMPLAEPTDQESAFAIQQATSTRLAGFVACISVQVEALSLGSQNTLDSPMTNLSLRVLRAVSGSGAQSQKAYTHWRLLLRPCWRSSLATALGSRKSSLEPGAAASSRYFNT